MQVPYENYRKAFRTSQRNVEKDLGAVNATAVDVSKRVTLENAEPADTVNAIDTMIARVEALKRKVRFPWFIPTLHPLHTPLAV